MTAKAKKKPDENDKLRAGTLPLDPRKGCVPMPPPAKKRGRRPDPSESDRPPHTVWPYRADASGLTYIKTTWEDGAPVYSEERLANFTARIVAQVLEDDGAEQRRMLEVEGAIGPGAARQFTIPSADLEGMAWPVAELGAGAIVEPGRGTRERLRHAVQTLSGAPTERVIYMHTGWRQVGGQWVYLHAGGGVGANGPVGSVTMRLEGELERYHLPAPLEGAELRSAIGEVLGLLDVAPRRVTVPLQCAPFRAALGPVDTSLYLVGTTGSGKTCLAALGQQFFGPAMHYENLPGSWESSDNALEALAFLCKDAVLVVDDFVHAGDARDRTKKERQADRVLRGAANGAGRQRMRPDATLRPTKRARGLIVSTGEVLPSNLSLRARMLVVDVKPGDVDLTRLTTAQRHASAGRFAGVMAAFLRWLAPRYGQVLAGLRDAAHALRPIFDGLGAHGRTPGAAANLLLGLKEFVRFALEVGALDAAQAERLEGDARAALAELVTRQTRVQRDADPVERFLELLRGALASGRAYVAGPQDEVPPDPRRWGWRANTEGLEEEDDQNRVWRPTGDRAGWVVGQDLYLLPAVVKGLAERCDPTFLVDERALGRQLAERGVLVAVDAARDTTKVRAPRTIMGAARCPVWHLRASMTAEPGDEDLEAEPEVSRRAAVRRGGVA